jgi:ligand-binding SRPBCC domain-containing protein
MIHTFQSSMMIPFHVLGVFEFFSNATNLERITPPELRFKILTPEPIKMGQGTRIDYHLQLYGIPFGWSSLINHWDPPRKFIDQQIKGPYKEWVHTHCFYDQTDGTEMTDEVSYRLPLWPFGEVFSPFIHLLISRIFRFREQTIREIFEKKCAVP